MVLTTIKLSQPGLSPPVYLAGTFTQWEASIEMDHDAVFGSSRDQHEFSKVVDIEAGEHQFKFRLGHGDWWIVDESAPTASDASGNVNNVIHVVDEGVGEKKVVEVNEQRVPVEEQKPATKVPEKVSIVSEEVAPVEKQVPLQKAPSKETLESKKTAPSETTAVDQQDDSSAQSILREPVTAATSQEEIKSSKHQQEPTTTNGNVAKTNGSASKVNGIKPAKKESSSFISKLLCCFSGKTVLGAAAVSALLVAVYVRR